MPARKHEIGILRQIAIVSGIFVYAASNAFLSGGLGTAGRDFGLTEFQVGVILSLGAIAVVPTAPFWGYVSELVGRRVLILIAIPIVLVGPLTMALVFSNTIALTVGSAFWVLAIARTIKGIFGGALIPSTQAYIADVTETRVRVSGMGLMGASVGFGALAGSMLLWATADRGIVSGFVVLMATGVAVFFLSLIFIPKTNAQSVGKNKAPVPILKVWTYFAITFCGFAAYTMVVPILGLKLMDDNQIASSEAIKSAGIVLTCSALALAGAQAIVASRSNWNANFLLRIGSIGALAGLAVMIAANSVITLALGMTLVGASLGAVAPGTLGGLSLVAGEGVQGKVAGVNTAFRGMGIAAGPILGTSLYRFGTDAPLYGAFLFVALIALVSFTNQPQISEL